MKNTILTKLALTLALLSSLIVLEGCSASLSRMSMGASTVTQVGNDGKVNTWHSKGKVLSEDSSDGWYFTDDKTGKVVIISGGSITITAD